MARSARSGWRRSGRRDSGSYPGRGSAYTRAPESWRRAAPGAERRDDGATIPLASSLREVLPPAAIDDLDVVGVRAHALVPGRAVLVRRVDAPFGRQQVPLVDRGIDR